MLQVFERAMVMEGDKLIFLGDYVDGWSESAAVISYLQLLDNRQECIFIKGNHDTWCADWLRTGEADNTRLFFGGKETIVSYDLMGTIKKKEQLCFFEKMKWYAIDDRNRLFIHAGFTSIYGPELEFDSPGFIWDRTLWEMALAMDKRVKKDPALLPQQLKLFHEIYIGHTPTLYFGMYKPMHACNVWNIDTGAAFTGRLTVMDINTKAFWQSEPVYQLYPGENGRNKK